MSLSAKPIVSALRERSETGEWVAQAAVLADDGNAVFVPGDLPCGDCGPCRRALVSCCLASRSWLGVGSPTLPSDLPERFTYEFDSNKISPRNAVWAALVAPLLEAMGRSGLGPGDTSIWIGTNATALLAATLAAGRGSKALLVGPAHLHEELALVAAGESEGLPQFVSWAELDAVALARAEESPGGFAERQVFVVSEDPMSWSAAVHLVAPGTTLVGFGGMQAIAGLPPDCRVITVGGRYNPDFVPEALAALSHNAGLLKVCDLLEQAGAYSVWPDGARA